MNNEKNVEANNVKPALQQNVCTTLREEVVQRLNSVNDILEMPNLHRIEAVRHFALKYAYEDVIKLIDAAQPFA